MSQTDFTKFLWKNHNLVYLRPANANDFQLLDVLVKVDKKWQFPCDRRPVLRRIGSLFGPVFGGITDVQSKNEEDEVTWQALKEELEELKSSAGRDFEGKYLHTVSHGQWKFQKDSSASARVSASACVAVETTARADYGYEYAINDVKSKSVDDTALTKCLSSETNPWTPDVAYISMCHAEPRNKRELELWVITKLFYHNGIHLQDSRGVRVEVRVEVTTPFTVGSGFGVGDNEKVEMDGPSAFAYQAIRLRYKLQQMDVQLIKVLSHMGTVRPLSRISRFSPLAATVGNYKIQSRIQESETESDRNQESETESEAKADRNPKRPKLKPLEVPAFGQLEAPACSQIQETESEAEFNIATDTNQDILRIKNGWWCKIRDPDFNMADLLDMEAWESLPVNMY